MPGPRVQGFGVVQGPDTWKGALGRSSNEVYVGVSQNQGYRYGGPTG